jgi:hypothetical protein
LTLASFVKVFYSAFMGPRNPDMKSGEVPKSMLLGMAVLAGMILVFSFLPSLVVREIVDPAVTALVGAGTTPDINLTLFSGQGAWNAVVLLSAFAVFLVIGFLIRMWGQKGTTPSNEGGKPYLFGNPTEINGRPLVVSGSNVYWGFVNALKRYYKPMEKLHSGLINEYVFWFVGTMGLVMLALTFL